MRPNFKILYLLAGFFFLFLFSSCILSIGNNKLLWEQLIDTESKNQVPFNGGEKLTFVSNLNEQVEITAGQREIELREYPYSGSYYNVEYNRLRIRSLDEPYIIDFELNAQNRDVTMGIFIMWDTITFVFLNDMPLDTSNTLYIDNLLVMDNWEKNVFYSETNTNNIHDYMYYSTKYGVVEFGIKDSIVWKLDNIVWE